MRLIYRYLLLALLGLCFLLPFIIIYTVLYEQQSIIGRHFNRPSLIHIIGYDVKPFQTKEKCRFYSCFNIFQCQMSRSGKIKVYIYPFTHYKTVNGDTLNNALSYEYESFLNELEKSEYVTKNSSEACLFIPSLDILSENGLDFKLITAALHSLSHWNGGKNHLIFNFFPLLPLPLTTILNIPTGDAMIASSNLLFSNNRQGFDISIPLFNSMTVLDVDKHVIPISVSRKWRVVVSQLSIDTSYRTTLRKLQDNSDDILMLRKCLGAVHNVVQHTQLCKDGLTFNFPDVLKDADFCLILPGVYFGTTLLLDALMMGCIPVVAMDDYLLPFHDVIDWERASIRLREYQLSDMMTILQKISEDDIKQKRYQGFFLWKKYFSSIKKILLATLDIYNERVFVNTKKSYEEWNGPFGFIQGNMLKPGAMSPLYYPLSPAKDEGFTAVILTYNRVEMLFILMEELDKVPSLAKIIVIWNNPYSKPAQEIQTEAVMAIDDDILMLTTDEIEFAYQAWREFPDRLVGFPARVHVTDPKETINGKKMKYKYESEWENELSMVLTGAAFYHKMYNHWFTYLLPFQIRDYIDEKMNCEDIGMNFLIANLTGKPPIKVSPRKRFKCAQCQGNDSLWSETSHFIKRSECLSVFTKEFGKMPLQPVEFRVDPVLFQEDIPQQMKAYPDLGEV